MSELNRDFREEPKGIKRNNTQSQFKKDGDYSFKLSKEQTQLEKSLERVNALMMKN